MCRAVSAFQIRHGHIEWSGDSLRIYFAHLRNDQSAERPRDPRHVYANTVDHQYVQYLHWVFIGAAITLTMNITAYFLVITSMIDFVSNCSKY